MEKLRGFSDHNYLVRVNGPKISKYILKISNPFEPEPLLKIQNIFFKKYQKISAKRKYSVPKLICSMKGHDMIMVV